jgi:hypothetical protein
MFGGGDGDEAQFVWRRSEAVVTSTGIPAQRRSCALVQWTSDNVRVDAHRFYERLGFVASHTGLKLQLPRS